MQNSDTRSVPVPINEDYRLEVLHSLNIIDNNNEIEYDRLTRLASRHFSTKMSFISLVGKERQWLKSVRGINVKETGKDVSFCAHGIAKRRPLIVLDATKDPRFCDNALVTGYPYIHFYAGIPIIVDNAAIGSFCIADDKPRTEFTAEDLKTLEDLAAIVQDQIQMLSVTQEQADTITSNQEKSQHMERAGSIAKQQFLALMSHELRTPLNAIIGFSDVINAELLGPIQNDAYKSYAGEISKSGHRLLSLVDRVLKLVQSGSLELEEEEFDLVQLIQFCTELLRSETLVKKVNLTLTVPPSPVNILNDITQTEQIILEIISNSIKFCQNEGEVSVCLEQDALGQIVFSTKNSGSTEVELTPDCDYKEIGYDDNIYTRSEEGMGIGLPLVQKLCGLIGARFFIRNCADNFVETKVFFPKALVPVSK
ncbi:MAG: GAF domain-containing sensor histidine kinase [Alphaproteobacteria bacterium]|nr:GAF domain-containing sensor histidine kinase [Alphaproteobacteria bacterium]